MNDSTDATAVFAPIWKRKWIILVIAILVSAGSYFYYKRQPSRYSASTQVYLGNGAEEQSQVGGSNGNGGKKASAPNPSTQAQLIDSSIIKNAVRARLRKEKKSPQERSALKGKVKAKAAVKSQFITINGEAHSARGVAFLVNVTAQAYVKRQNARYRREVATAIALTRRQIRKIEAEQAGHASAKGKSGGKGGSSASSTLQAATLTNKVNQLENDLSISQVAQVDPATRKSAKLVSPHPKSNAIFGFAIGLLLASFAAYALSRLDRRLRSLSAIEQAFHAQILTALPAVRRPVVHRDGHPAPAKAMREALWRLQTTLQVGQGQASANNGGSRTPRTLLCVSADAGDGKSTLVATLALALSEAGERVAVIEADFRRPVQSKLLDVKGHQGLSDLLSGRLTVEEAMQVVSPARTQAGVGAPAGVEGATATVVETAGSVSVLLGDTKVANPPALLSRPVMSELPRALADEFDYVLIDAPPPLLVSDVMPLLGTVDGILIVARVGHTRGTSAERLVQLLAQTPSAPVLGIAANAVSPSDIERYGLSGRNRHRWRHKLIGR
jgi:Mrp family chromosome partitioning ATPase/capsular polysaccharide biosynthesis protein